MAMQGSVWMRVLVVTLCLLALPAVSTAQSQFTGQVKDESGGVLPGVTVEASSPALIEKSKTAMTDSNGRFTIIDLRQGTYKVVFTLTGFSTVVREGIELQANFVSTINAEMKVGALEETVTVSGQTPLVDVTQAARTQVITRDTIDALPTTRNIQSIGQLVPGVRMGNPDVGGTQQTEQTRPRVHGIAANNTTNYIDGMNINSQEVSQAQAYMNDALSAEVSVVTAAQPAEIQSGGMRTNTIPKDGGNVVSGSVFLGGSDGNWQSDNVDAYLKSQNFSLANGVAHIQNFNGSLGGPVAKDRLWFFISARHLSTDTTVANTPEYIVAPNGDFIRSAADAYVRDSLARVTWQMNQSNKLAGFFERIWKRVGKAYSFGEDPRAATFRNPHTGHYGVGNVKYTNTLSSRLLLEAGYSTNYAHSTQSNRPERDYPRFLSGGTINPAWFTNGRRTDTALNINPDCAYSFGCTAWMSNGPDHRVEDTRKVLTGSISYVTGSHNIKIGFQDSFGPVHVQDDRQADLIEVFSAGKPSTVTVFTTPGDTFDHVNFDLGYYMQDIWTIKRLTVSPGLRVDNFNSAIDATADPAGRFVPARYFPARENVPNWIGYINPRLSAAYDLFGDGKTAVKAAISKYLQPLTGSFADTYAPGLQSESRAWFDCDINAAGTACSGLPLATNGDNVAQNNEIGPSSTTNFGLTSADRDFDPNIKWNSNWEAMASVSHQLFTRVSVSAGYYRRTFQNIQITDRTKIVLADYTSFTAPMPAFTSPSLAGGIDGTLTGVLDPAEVLTIYNLSAAKKSVFGSALLDINAPDQSIYNGLDVTIQGRLKGGSTIIGSWTSEKNVSVFCSSDDDPNGPTKADLYTGASASSGGRFCDQRKFDIPWTNEFKLAGTYPVALGIDLGAVLQSYAGSPRAITWTPAAGLFPGGRTNSETLVLSKPGSLFYPRYNQLDLNVKKNFRVGRKTFSGQMDLFNALNGNAIFTRNNSIGSSLGQVTSILQGRIVRLAFQMKF
jgi:carboxypeptidase family protein/TonB-dependent receptor-like protein